MDRLTKGLILNVVIDVILLYPAQPFLTFIGQAENTRVQTFATNSVNPSGSEAEPIKHKS